MIAALLGAILAAVGCSDDTTAPDLTPTTLLTVVLNDWVHGAGEGLVFVSSVSGDLLDTKYGAAGDTLVFDIGEPRPEMISYTVVIASPYHVGAYTELGVPAGTTRTVGEEPNDSSIGSATVTMLGAPDGDGWIVATANWFDFGLASLPGSSDVPLTQDQGDCFVRVDPIGGTPLGAWARDLQVDETRTVDFAEPGVAEELTGYDVTVPSGGVGLSCRLYAEEPGVTAPNLILVDLVDTFDLPESVVLHAPEIAPRHHVSLFYLVGEGMPRISYWQETRGTIPSAFTKLPGDLTVDTDDAAAVAFDMTGPWDRFVARWTQRRDTYGVWFVTGEAPSSGFALPQLPPEFMALYPDFTREAYVLESLELIEEGDGTTLTIVWEDWVDREPVATHRPGVGTVSPGRPAPPPRR